jgi:hypothetical protein
VNAVEPVPTRTLLSAVITAVIRSIRSIPGALSASESG